MFSKKAKVLIATAVLTALGVAVTGVASARINVASTVKSAAVVPAHDRAGGSHLDAAATALGMTVEELRTALVAGTSLADVAATKGVAVQKVIDAIVAAEKAEISQHVTDGKLTQARADELLAGLASRVTAMVNADVPAFGRGGRGFGGEGHGKGHGMGRGHGLPGLHDSTVLEDTLGMTREEIRAGLEAGKSIADLAKEKGVDVQKVIDALVAEARTKITDMVNGTLATADQL
ncbi:MAG: hypothetical protein RLZZ284_28 [Actinomycetota bacterium]|jgi:hypothetical protein